MKSIYTETETDYTKESSVLEQLAAASVRAYFEVARLLGFKVREASHLLITQTLVQEHSIIAMRAIEEKIHDSTGPDRRQSVRRDPGSDPGGEFDAILDRHLTERLREIDEQEEIDEAHRRGGDDESDPLEEL